MWNYLKILACAALLLGWTTAQAAVVESTESDDLLDAVDEITSTLSVDGPTDLTIFVNGTYVATAVLQREVGSPGSGAWENVLVVTDGTDDATVVSSYKSGPGPGAYRVKMTAFTSGDIAVQLTDGSLVPQVFAEGDDYIRHYDDFFSHTATIDAALYITDENDAGGTVAVVTPAIQEGAVTIISGTGGDDADEVCFSLIDLTDFGALVSDGWTAFETRLKSSVTTGQFGMLLHDEECVSTQLTPFDIDSNVVGFDTTNQANSVGIVHSEEADDVDGWTAVSANADTLGNNADEMEVGTVVAATYVTLRVEVDSTGDAYFYIDGILKYAENETVATTARLIPFIWVDTTTDDGGDPTVDIDYLEFVMSRPPA